MDEIALLREEVALARAEAKLQKTIADGYSRSASLEFRDTLEAEIRELRELGQFTIRRCFEHMTSDNAARVKAHPNYSRTWEMFFLGRK